MMGRPGAPGYVLLLLLAGACSFATEPSADVADVRGSWQYSGEQAAPTLTLEGTLIFESQSGDVVTGRVSWQEQDPGGGTRMDGGAVSGRVIERFDVDFDVLRAGGDRRHVGRIAGDTIRGAWLEIQSGKSGTFVAVRIP